MSKLLLAESGGTKTDWCLIESGRVLDRFETEGLHPDTSGTSQWAGCTAELKNRVDPLECELIFYGAGCYNERGKEKTLEALRNIGFKRITVRSDLHAAGMALFGKGRGWGAIMGTGSVLFFYNNGKIETLIGGKGHLEGDEGSAFYFGKLMYEAASKGEMNAEQQKVYDEHVDVGQLKASLGTDAEKYVISSLGVRLGRYSELYANFHEENIRRFLESYVSGHAEGISEVAFTGSYAFYCHEHIREVFEGSGVKVLDVIRKPMDVLIEQIAGGVD